MKRPFTEDTDRDYTYGNLLSSEVNKIKTMINMTFMPTRLAKIF